MEPLVRDVDRAAATERVESVPDWTQSRLSPPVSGRAESLLRADNACMDDAVARNADRLVAAIAPLESCLVAYSGGVDSAVVAKAAHLALGERALAVTGVSASLAAGELEAAQRIAAAIGIRHETLATDELADADYLRNAPDRCFHCKTELYEQLRPQADRARHRSDRQRRQRRRPRRLPPRHAGRRRHGVRSPLAECGLDQGRRARAGPALGHRGLGQAGDALPVEPHRLRRRASRPSGWRGSTRPSRLLRSLGLGDGARAAARKRPGPARSAARGAAAAVRAERPRRRSSRGCASWASAT